MMTAQRREELKKVLLEQKSASVQEMSDRFDVSGQTIRRDFEALEKEGFLLRSYGGAMVKDRKAVVVPNTVKSELLVNIKHRIAREAARFLCPNDCIFIDHSTTALALCDEIVGLPLTVVTNSFRVVERLSSNTSVRLISAGGVYHSEFDGFFGSETVEYLQKHCVDKAFLSCRSLDLRRGLSDSDEIVASVRRTVIENADSVYLLADHTKFGKSGFITICEPSALKCVITDQPLEPDWTRLFADNGVQIIDCPPLVV